MDGDVLRVIPVGEATGTVTCPTCGSVSEDDRFCTECGEVIETALEER